jgi:MFS family permease
MVRAAASAPAQAEGGLRAPTFAEVFRAGAPGFLREGFIPVGAFYVGLELGGLAAGIVAGAVVAVLVYLYERRAGRDGLLARISLGFVALQSIVGLASNSATIYLAQPVLIAAAWGFAFLVSAAIGRPLAGALAAAWYPFPKEFRETPEFKRVFGVESVVWGAYFLARSALRLGALLNGSLENFLLITFVTGTPVMLLLMAWSIHYSIRELSD